MAASDTRLTLMVFPQRIAGQSLAVRLLAAPTTNPLTVPAADILPFADGPLAIDIRLQRTLADLPAPGEGELLASLVLPVQPKARYLFEAFAARYPGAAVPPPAAGLPPKLRVLKVATPGYLAAVGASRLGSPDLIPADDYACAVHASLDPQNRPPRPPARADLTWNQIFARSLRQPILAEALGLVRPFAIDLAADALADGGYLWAEPSAGSPWSTAAAVPDRVRLYAARLPRIKVGTARPLMAAVHFPVKAGAAGPGYDMIFAEADAYSDGFARIVHATQPERHDPFNVARADHERLAPSTDGGIRLGWDDEQLLVWLNRQLSEDPRLGAGGRDTPLGVLGWRIDVRQIDDGLDDLWRSLVRVTGEPIVEGIALDEFEGELGVELPPSVQRRVALAGGGHVDHAWLPAEGVRWSGGSLLGFDPVRSALTGRALHAQLAPIDADAVVLRYGHTYEFRVRMMDLSGGGPTFEEEAVNQAIHGTARCRYRRYAAPRSLDVSSPNRDGARRVSFSIRRPTVGHPDALYLPGDRAARQAALLDQAAADPAERVELAVPDSDVTQVRISIAVGVPEGDPASMNIDGAPRRLLFGGPIVRLFRDDPDAPIELGFKFVDIHDVDELAAPTPGGDIELPSSREIYVEFTPVCRPDPAMVRAGREDPVLLGTLPPHALAASDESLDYFGNQAARQGPTSQYQLREPAGDENGLILPLAHRPPLSAILIATQSGGTTSDTVARLSTALDLGRDGMMLKARPGERTLLACTPRVPHIADDTRAVLTFASEVDLEDRWVVAVRLVIDRDWSWTGLSVQGLEVHREEGGRSQLVGHVPLPPFLAGEAVADPPRRASTSILFLDVVDPKVEGKHPAERLLGYRVEAVLRDPADIPPEAWTGQMRLPVAARPVDRPAIVSAGLAQSSYVRDEGYSRTGSRERMLWLEFAHPPANPEDIVCARALAWGPDPALTSTFAQQSDATDPPLSVPDESVRIIVPDQPDDDAGADAMQPLIPTRSPVRFLVPLHPGLEASSAQLFGFFRYEFRFAHGPDQWSTARARYGEATIVDGIRHPPPDLECGAVRLGDKVIAYAAAAVPASPDHPRELGRAIATEVWFLLYGQALKADGSDMRNILLSRRRGFQAEGAALHHALPRVRATWRPDEIRARLEALALDPATPLSVLAIELLAPADGAFTDPVAGDLGEVSFLRTSTLVPVPDACIA